MTFGFGPFHIKLLAESHLAFAYPPLVLSIDDLIDKMTQSLGASFSNFLSRPSFLLISGYIKRKWSDNRMAQVFVYFILGGIEPAPMVQQVWL